MPSNFPLQLEFAANLQWEKFLMVGGVGQTQQPNKPRGRTALWQFARRQRKQSSPHFPSIFAFLFGLLFVFFSFLFAHTGLQNKEKKVSLFRQVPSSTMSSGNLAQTLASGLLKSCGHSEWLFGGV